MYVGQEDAREPKRKTLITFTYPAFFKVFNPALISILVSWPSRFRSINSNSSLPSASSSSDFDAESKIADIASGFVRAFVIPI